MNGWSSHVGADRWDDEPAWVYEITWEWEPTEGKRYPGDPGRRRAVHTPVYEASRGDNVHSIGRASVAPPPGSSWPGPEDQREYARRDEPGLPASAPPYPSAQRPPREPNGRHLPNQPDGRLPNQPAGRLAGQPDGRPAGQPEGRPAGQVDGREYGRPADRTPRPAGSPPAQRVEPSWNRPVPLPERLPGSRSPEPTSPGRTPEPLSPGRPPEPGGYGRPAEPLSPGRPPEMLSPRPTDPMSPGRPPEPRRAAPDGRPQPVDRRMQPPATDVPHYDLPGDQRQTPDVRPPNGSPYRPRFPDQRRDQPPAAPQSGPRSAPTPYRPEPDRQEPDHADLPRRRRDERPYDTGRDERRYDPARDQPTFDVTRDDRRYDPARDQPTFDVARDERRYDPAGDERRFDPARDERTYDAARDERTYDAARDEPHDPLAGRAPAAEYRPRRSRRDTDPYGFTWTPPAQPGAQPTAQATAQPDGRPADRPGHRRSAEPVTAPPYEARPTYPAAQSPVAPAPAAPTTPAPQPPAPPTRPPIAPTTPAAPAAQASAPPTAPPRPATPASAPPTAPPRPAAPASGPPIGPPRPATPASAPPTAPPRPAAPASGPPIGPPRPATPATPATPASAPPAAPTSAGLPSGWFDPPVPESAPPAPAVDRPDERYPGDSRVDASDRYPADDDPYRPSWARPSGPYSVPEAQYPDQGMIERAAPDYENGDSRELARIRDDEGSGTWIISAGLPGEVSGEIITGEIVVGEVSGEIIRAEVVPPGSVPGDPRSPTEIGGAEIVDAEPVDGEAGRVDDWASPAQEPVEDDPADDARAEEPTQPIARPERIAEPRDETTDDGTADDGTADDGTADDGTADDGTADDGTADEPRDGATAEPRDEAVTTYRDQPPVGSRDRDEPPPGSGDEAAAGVELHGLGWLLELSGLGATTPPVEPDSDEPAPAEVEPAPEPAPTADHVSEVARIWGNPPTEDDPSPPVSAQPAAGDWFEGTTELEATDDETTDREAAEPTPGATEVTDDDETPAEVADAVAAPAAADADREAANTPAAERADREPVDEPRLVDPEQILAAYHWEFDPKTLREKADDPDRLRAVRDRLTDKLEYAERDAVRARLLSLRAVVSRILGDLGRALADGRQALQHAEATGELRRTAIAAARLAHVLQWRGEYAEADRLFAEANSVELPDRLRAEMYEHAGRSAFEQGRYFEAMSLFEQALNVRQGEDLEMVARVEVALDAVHEKISETRDWGPYSRSREEILHLRKAPEPTYDDRTRLWGFADAVPPRYREVQPFHEGVAWARRPDAHAWELIDESGDVLVGASAGYLGVTDFAEGLAWVSRSGTGDWFAIDRGNREVIAGRFDGVRPFRRGVAVIRHGGWGAVDRHGGVVVQPKYRAFATQLSGGQRIDGFTDEGLAVVDAGDRLGVVDRAGRLIVSPEHAALMIHPVAFLVGDTHGRWGALDRRGDPLIDVVHPAPADVTQEIDRLLADTRPVL